MARERKQPESEQEAGAPEWMVTFSDCMTLLLTFFVLLLSFSSFSDKDNFRKMNSSFAAQFSFGKSGRTEKEAMTEMPIFSQDVRWGSEKPTEADGFEDRFKEQTKPPDYLKYNTFLIPSDEMFWGKGTVISRHGQHVLTDLSVFLKAMPHYFVIISETGSQDVMQSTHPGFDRAWAVRSYLKTEKGIDSQRLIISAYGTAVQEYHAYQKSRDPETANDRILEIALLKRSS
jgi:flagellar motor protein MotB